MKLVLDACVGLKIVLPESDSAAARALMDDYEKQIHELVAPDTYLIECAHALTRAERKGVLQPPEAQEKFENIAASSPVLFPYVPLLTRAIEISSSMRLGAYDCLYLALAEQEGCKLVTTDRKLIDTFPNDVIALSDL